MKPIEEHFKLKNTKLYMIPLIGITNTENTHKKTFTVSELSNSSILAGQRTNGYKRLIVVLLGVGITDGQISNGVSMSTILMFDFENQCSHKNINIKYACRFFKCSSVSDAHLHK